MQMDEAWVTVAAYQDALEAHLVLNLLDEHGIHGLLQDENLSQIGWHFTRAIGGVKVCVPQSDFKNAAELIAQQEGQAAEARGKESSEEKLARIQQGNPQRAYRMALFSLFLPPLAFWSLWIVYSERTSERNGELTKVDRSNLNRAAVLSVLIVTTFTLVLVLD